jgi:hypothetical protein
MTRSLVLVLLALGPREAHAYCPAPTPPVHQEFIASDAVFTGTVLDERVAPARGSAYDGWTYRVRVSRVFRGARVDVLEVFTENSSGRRRLRVGGSYLLFASSAEGRLEITNCGHSGPTDKRPRTLGLLEDLSSS